MIHAKNLSKSFGDTEAVKDISLELEKGEILGLLGPNGAGKTTTLKMLSGLLKPDSGNLEVENSLREDVAVVFQETDYGSKLTVTEFLNMISVLNEGVYPVDKAIQDVGLSNDRGKYVKNLSGGTKKKLNMAAGLLKDPKYLLLDEPVAGLDPRATNKVLEALEKLSDSKGLLISTHSMSMAEMLCDKVLIMEKGQEVVSGMPDELISQINAGYLIKAEGEVPERYIDSAITADNFFEIKTDKPDEVLRHLVESDEMTDLANFTVEKPGLEDVFLKLTGRRYSEEGK